MRIVLTKDEVLQFKTEFNASCYLSRDHVGSVLPKNIVVFGIPVEVEQ